MLLTAKLDCALHLLSKQFELGGSSQWIIAKDLSQQSNVFYLSKNALRIGVDYDDHHLSLAKYTFLSYISLSDFEPHCQLCTIFPSMIGIMMPVVQI